MNKLFKVNLICPFCKKEIEYNIASFKAKHECKHCENELIVRAKTIVSSVISIIGFILIFSIVDLLQIYELGKLPTLLIILVGCLTYQVIAYSLYCKIYSADKLYIVDAQDPTLLKHYKKKK